MIGELNIILMAFSPCFSRTAAFHWFVVTVFAMIVRLDFHGVSSFIRWLALDPNDYETLLSFFRASSWQLSKIHRCWVDIIKERCPLINIYEVPSEETVPSVIQKNFYYNFINHSDTAIHRIITAKQRNRLYLYTEEAE